MTLPQWSPTRPFSGCPTEQILAAAAVGGRALVTANINRLRTPRRRLQGTGRNHAGLILVTTKTFPQDRSFVGTIVSSPPCLPNQTCSCLTE